MFDAAAAAASFDVDRAWGEDKCGHFPLLNNVGKGS